MLFFLHYILMTSGLSGTSVLLGVYLKTYTDATQGEIGVLLMSFPFVSLIVKPLFCSMADRKQAHRLFLQLSLLIEMAGFVPFLVVPFFPAFYLNHQRLSWYLLVVSCHVGLGGLGVAWSLGECLAMNYSLRTGVHYGKMRLMGTVGWGIYGFIIGQINETPLLPRYLPSFIILHVSLLVEIIMISLWKNEDFEMIDASSSCVGAHEQPVDACGQLSGNGAQGESVGAPREGVPCERTSSQMLAKLVDSTPSSLNGTLRVKPEAASIFKEILAADELETLYKRLKGAEQKDKAEVEQVAKNGANNIELGQRHAQTEGGDKTAAQVDEKKQKAKLQYALLWMIFREDGRVVKYIVLFVLFGIAIQPITFLFMSMELHCKGAGDCNFSQLAGSVLISQASIETLMFLVMPLAMQYMTRRFAFSFGFLILAARFLFYAGWYYTADISPYWAVLGEWAHGISYAIFATLQAELALLIASESRLFIPELKKLGLLSETKDPAQIQREEFAIKMALRATMAALFNGFMDGLGQGLGALLCGVVAELYSYIFLWQIYFCFSICSLLLYLLVELSRTRWSDAYKPKAGTKAYEIMQLNGGSGRVVAGTKAHEEKKKGANEAATC